PEVAGDVGEAIGHAGAAGDAVDQAPSPFQHAARHALRAAHLPQHVHVDAADAAGALMRFLGLGDAAGDAVGDQLLMPLGAGAALIDLRDGVAAGRVAVGVDAREGADAAARGPAAAGRAVRHRHALAALDQGENLDAAHADRVDHLQGSLA